MRIRYWSSDVCSSDLRRRVRGGGPGTRGRPPRDLRRPHPQRPALTSAGHPNRNRGRGQPTPTMRGVIDLDSGGVTVRVGVLGGGNVGGPLIELIADRGHEIEARTGLRLQVTRIAVRDRSEEHTSELQSELLTTDARSIVHDPHIDVIVEVIGGMEPARELILAALKAGKPVINGNKR